MMDTFVFGKRNIHSFIKTEVKKLCMNLLHLQQKHHNNSFVTVLQEINQYTKIKYVKHLHSSNNNFVQKWTRLFSENNNDFICTHQIQFWTWYYGITMAFFEMHSRTMYIQYKDKINKYSDHSEPSADLFLLCKCVIRSVEHP